VIRVITRDGPDRPYRCHAGERRSSTAAGPWGPTSHAHRPAGPHRVAGTGGRPGPAPTRPICAGDVGRVGQHEGVPFSSSARRCAREGDVHRPEPAKCGATAPRPVAASWISRGRGRCPAAPPDAGRRRASPQRDTPERGSEIQQPVQRRAPNDGESDRTATDAVSPWPALTGHSWTVANLSNVTGVKGSQVQILSARQWENAAQGSCPERSGTAPGRFLRRFDHHFDRHQVTLTPG